MTRGTITTFAEALDLKIGELEANGHLSGSTRGKYARLRRELGNTPLSDVAERFEAWCAEFVAHQHRGKMRRRESLNNPTNIVRTTFGNLIALGIWGENPITKRRFPKYRETPRNRYLSLSERPALFASIRKYRLCILPMVQFMLAVPCRVGELIPAKREQYNPSTNTILIPTSKTGIAIYKPVPPDMVDYFRNIPPNCPWLFYWFDDDGCYNQLKSVQRWFRECCHMAGITDFRVHDLRHTAATDLYEAGNPELMIMEVAGWRTRMLSVYWHKNSLRSAQAIQFPNFFL